MLELRQHKERVENIQRQIIMQPTYSQLSTLCGGARLILLDANEFIPNRDFKNLDAYRGYGDHVNSYVRWYCNRNRKVEGDEWDKLYWQTYLNGARARIFNDYLLFLEHKREPRKMFYKPKIKQFEKFQLIESYQGMLDDKYDILCISMPPGTGKAQPLYSKVLTPNGFVQMGDLKVGDKVFAANGNESTVVGIFPQGKRKIYEITLDDGSKCRASDNHLWTVQSRHDRRISKKHPRETYRTITTEDMIKNLYVENGKRKNYSIDYIKPIDFPTAELKLHPYVMGILIGDGYLGGTPTFSTGDPEVIDLVNSFLPPGYKVKHKDRCTYIINGHEKERRPNSLVTKAVKEYGLFGHTAAQKFIPKNYLYGSKEQRLWLLKGLMDADGTTDGGNASYCTISEQLANDIIELVHSLGGYASKQVKKSGYKDKNGNYVTCHDSYNVQMEFDSSNSQIFATTKKQSKYKPKRERIRRFVKSIEYIGDDECQCIYIDDSSHLYITDDYIATHNTTLLKFFHSAVIGWFPDDYSLFYSHSGDITRMYYDGVYQMVDDALEYAWHDIFPDLKITSTNALMQQFNVGKYKPFPSLQTTSVGAKSAGKVRASKFLLTDDMIGSLEETLNKNYLDKMWGAYTVDALQRKTVDSNNNPCKEIMQATRWSTQDVIGRLIDIYDGNNRVRVISIPATDPETGDSNFDYAIGGFTKEFFAKQALLMDDVSYNCLYMQQPVEREGLLFPEEKIMRYKELPTSKIECITAQADTKSTGTDFFVLPVLIKYEGKDLYYCVDCVCSNSSDYEAQYENSANLLADNKVEDCEFEGNSGGDRVSLEVDKRVLEKGWICNISSRMTETNKEARIYQCSNWILQHVVFKDKKLYTPKEPYGVMMSLLAQYSTSGKKQLDDVPDTFANFALRIQRRKPRPTRIINSIY